MDDLPLFTGAPPDAPACSQSRLRGRPAIGTVAAAELVVEAAGGMPGVARVLTWPDDAAAACYDAMHRSYPVDRSDAKAWDRYHAVRAAVVELERYHAVEF